MLLKLAVKQQISYQEMCWGKRKNLDQQVVELSTFTNAIRAGKNSVRKKWTEL